LSARRGLDVRPLLPDKSDFSGRSIALAHSHYTDLLQTGVKIYETHGVVLHSKTLVVDGVWSAIGSSNFDHRSIIFNDQVDVIGLGSDTANELETLFRDDSQRPSAIDLSAWKNRAMSQKLKEALVLVWQNLL
jgi:cardiolipin synthase A/B